MHICTRIQISSLVVLSGQSLTVQKKLMPWHAWRMQQGMAPHLLVVEKATTGRFTLVNRSSAMSPLAISRCSRALQCNAFTAYLSPKNPVPPSNHTSTADSQYTCCIHTSMLVPPFMLKCWVNARGKPRQKTRSAEQHYCAWEAGSPETMQW